MESFPIVDLLDEGPDGAGRLLEVPVLSQVYLFVFQSLEEALRLGVVIGVALPTHADLKVSLKQKRHILVAGILDAPTRMMNASGGRAAILKGRPQGRHCQPGIETPG